LKFVGLAVPKIWLIFGHDVNWPSDLDMICRPLNGVTGHWLPSCKFWA